MTDFLVNYAINNFWCNPSQNKQNIFKVARLFSPAGVMNYCTVTEIDMSLPTNSEAYHVFQIGQITNSILNLDGPSPSWIYDSWTSIGNTIGANNVWCDIYNQNGIQIPRFDVYYRYSRNKNLILAIKENSKINVSYGTDDIYFRVYSNAYYNLTTVPVARLYYYGTTIHSSADMLSAQVIYLTYRAMNGACICYVNGMVADSLTAITMTLGDCIEFIHDPSIKHTFTVSMANVQTFISALDNTNKYLLHDSIATGTTINYEQNIEVYITNYTGNSYIGTYYHRNGLGSHRMVTHRDYAINVYYATFLMNAFKSMNSSITNINQLSFTIYVRQSGFNHSLIYDDNRILSMYKMNDSQVQQALTGTNSTCRPWQASNLENSAYTLVMRSQFLDLTDTIIQSALGYNSYSKIIADTPSIPYLSSLIKMADIPLGLQTGCCAYEYDNNGIMLGYYNNMTGSQYIVSNSNCSSVEFIYGLGGLTAPMYFGETSLAFNANANYRVYSCSINSVPLNDWKDITKDINTYYTVTNNILSLNIADPSRFLMVKTDERIVNYDIQITPINGLLYFTLSDEENRNGTYINYIALVPYRDIDIFLNGYSLIEGIDYIIQYPEVVIINFNRLIQPANNTVQHIHVRMSGFCDSSLKYKKAYDIGFIADSAFSNALNHDILDDCVVRYVVGGEYVNRSQLGITSNSLAGVIVASIYNGLPYSVRKPMIPIQNLINSDILTYISESETIDTEVANYLTVSLPTLSQPLASIPSPYSVVSPFICKLVYSLANNTASNMASVTIAMTDNDVITFCNQFANMLAFDPIVSPNTIDSRFIQIIPINSTSVVKLPIAQYRLVNRAIALFSQNQMTSMSSFISIM